MYAEIDRLERAPITEDRTRQYEEWFAWPLAAALALAAAGMAGPGRAVRTGCRSVGGVTFANPAWVHLVWLALAFAGVIAWLELRGRDRLGRFVSPAMQARLAHGASTARRALRVTLVLATLLLGIVALMRPQTPGGTEVAARGAGADIVVALDVSRSMLAEDAAPNRLARAKADIREFLDRVTAHRVGLVAFAGRASVMCPLTTDYGYFHLVLNNTDSRSVARGGTRLGDAIRKAVEAFGPNRGASRLLLLITDGEDHDSFPIDAARGGAPGRRPHPPPSASAARKAARSP